MQVELHSGSISELWEAKRDNVPTGDTYGQISWVGNDGVEAVRCTFRGYSLKDLEAFQEMAVPLIITCDMRFDVYNRNTMVNVHDLHVKIDDAALKLSLDFFKQQQKSG